MGTKDMCKQNGLLVRSGKASTTYYFQARIPSDCLAFFRKPLIRERLTATTHSEAKTQVRLRLAKLEADLARLRHPPTTVSEEDATRILAALVASRLSADEEERQLGLDDDAFQRVTAVIDELDRAERKVAARGDLRGIQEQAADWLQAYGYDISEDSPQFRSFALRFAKASQGATKLLTLRQQGDFVETPKVEPPVVPKADHKATAGAPLLSEVVGYFLQNYDQRKPMYRKHASVLPAFVSCIGDRPVDQLKQMDIEDFCKLMCKLPPRWSSELHRRKISMQELAALEHPKTMAPKTFEDTYLASVRPFLSSARRIFGDKGFPGHLTTDGIAYRGTVKAGENKQRAFKPDELRKLFAHLGQLATKPKDAHLVWLPLVALYTGARVNEICQLNPQADIAEERGIPYLHFTGDTEGDSRIRKSVKNATSQRRVPIHSALLRAGLLEYVKAIKVTGSKLLFPQWKPGHGKASDNAELWFIGVLKDTGLRDETPGQRLVGMHAFRSTFLNRAHNLRIDGAEWITGHVGDNSAVVRGYLGELELKNKRDIIEQITFNLGP